MIEITAQVVGMQEVVARLAGESDRIHKRVRRAVERSGIEVQRLVKDSYLTGGALDVRTGRLRRSVTQETTDDGTTIRSRVGTNVAYGRFWELGFSGTEQVRAHMRANKAGKMRIGGKLRKVMAMVPVRAHTREVHQRPRPFLGPALRMLSQATRERILRALGETDGG